MPTPAPEGFPEETPVDWRVFLRAMRRVNALFDAFCMHTNEATVRQYLFRAYVQMPQKGEVSRVAVWREYGVLTTPPGASGSDDPLTWSDDLIISVIDSMGIPI